MLRFLAQECHRLVGHLGIGDEGLGLLHRRHDHLLEADRDDRGGVHGEGERRVLRIPHEWNVFGEVEARSAHLQMGHGLSPA